MNQNILDDFTPEAFVPPIIQRIVWYFKHAVAVIILLSIVVIIILEILPNLPKSIAEFVSGITLISLILGMYGITLYTYVKGFKWSLGGGLLGGTISFFSCFIYVMDNRKILEAYYHQYFPNLLPMETALQQEFLEVFVVGVAYSLLIIPCTEIMVWIGFFIKAAWNWNNKRSKS